MPEPVIVLIHGTKSTPESNWLPWLSAELTQRNLQTITPCFPTPQGQTLSNWRSQFHNAIQDLTATRGQPVLPSQITLVGHSLGVPFALRLAEEAGRGTTTPYRAIVGVCPFAETLGIDTYDKLNHDFVVPAWDWRAVSAGARQFAFFAGNNDPYVPVSTARNVLNAIGNGTFDLIEKGGHLNTDSGYKEFPLLLEKILHLTGEVSNV